eukprot:3692115-Amphidinium_carterae.1
MSVLPASAFLHTGQFVYLEIATCRHPVTHHCVLHQMSSTIALLHTLNPAAFDGSDCVDGHDYVPVNGISAWRHCARRL